MVRTAENLIAYLHNLFPIRLVHNSSMPEGVDYTATLPDPSGEAPSFLRTLRTCILKKRTLYVTPEQMSLMEPISQTCHIALELLEENTVVKPLDWSTVVDQNADVNHWRNSLTPVERNAILNSETFGYLSISEDVLLQTAVNRSSKFRGRELTMSHRSFYPITGQPMMEAEIMCEQLACLQDHFVSPFEIIRNNDSYYSISKVRPDDQLSISIPGINGYQSLIAMFVAEHKIRIESFESNIRKACLLTYMNFVSIVRIARIALTQTEFELPSEMRQSVELIANCHFALPYAYGRDDTITINLYTVQQPTSSTVPLSETNWATIEPIVKERFVKSFKLTSANEIRNAKACMSNIRDYLLDVLKLPQFLSLPDLQTLLRSQCSLNVLPRSSAKPSRAPSPSPSGGSTPNAEGSNSPFAKKQKTNSGAKQEALRFIQNGLSESQVLSLPDADSIVIRGIICKDTVLARAVGFTPDQTVVIKLGDRNSYQMRHELNARRHVSSKMEVAIVMPKILAIVHIPNSDFLALVLEDCGHPLASLAIDSWASLRQASIGVCHALSLIHRTGLLHLDITPYNIAVHDTAVRDSGFETENEENRPPEDNLIHEKMATELNLWDRRKVSPYDHLVIVLLDFGLSEIECSGSTMSGRRGTEKYSAPEVNSGMVFNSAADVYSAGIVLKEVSCLVHDAPAAFRELLSCMTHSDPLKRPSADDAVCSIRQMP